MKENGLRKKKGGATARPDRSRQPTNPSPDGVQPRPDELSKGTDMAENENTNDQNPAQEGAAPEQEPVFQLVRCYLMDASLEMPNAPGILLEEAKEPDVDIKFEVSTQLLAENVYDVAVRGTITVKSGDRTMILVEGKQSGLFSIAGLPEEALAHVTNVLCPTMVYPYLRSNLADLMVRANVPPVHMPEVNFEVLYQQRLAQAQAELDKQQAEGAAPEAAN